MNREIRDTDDKNPPQSSSNDTTNHASASRTQDETSVPSSEHDGEPRLRGGATQVLQNSEVTVSTAGNDVTSEAVPRPEVPAFTNDLPATDNDVVVISLGGMLTADDIYSLFGNNAESSSSSSASRTTRQTRRRRRRTSTRRRSRKSASPKKRRTSKSGRGRQPAAASLGGGRGTSFGQVLSCGALSPGGHRRDTLYASADPMSMDNEEDYEVDSPDMKLSGGKKKRKQRKSSGRKSMKRRGRGRAGGKKRRASKKSKKRKKSKRSRKSKKS